MKHKNDFLEIVPGQEQSIQQTVQQQQPVRLENQQQQQQQACSDFESEFVSDFDHGQEIQHPQNPDFREFLPGKKSASAT